MERRRAPDNIINILSPSRSLSHKQMKVPVPEPILSPTIMSPVAIFSPHASISNLIPNENESNIYLRDIQHKDSNDIS